MNDQLKEIGLSCLKILNEQGFEAFWVGGCVRNPLLGLPAEDLDITTSARPEETLRIFKDQGWKIIETGIRHGTVTVVRGQTAVEITTYRTEQAYRDHRHPDSVQFTRSLKADCARRDFTANALCWHPDTGIKDFFGGLQDLQNGCLRCIGDPDQRFQEDALRILRALRFSSVLGFHIDPETEVSLIRCQYLLKNLSAERIAREMEKMAVGKDWVRVLERYFDLFTSLFALPFSSSPFSIQNTLDYARRCPALVSLRLAGLFLYPQDTLPLNAEAARQFADQLKFSRHRRADLIQLVRYSDRKIDLNRITMRQLIAEVKDLMIPLIQLQTAQGKHTEEESQALIQLAVDITRHDCLTLKQLALSGHDLKTLPLPTTMYSQLLQSCLKQVLSGQLPNDTEVLMCWCRSEADRLQAELSAISNAAVCAESSKSSNHEEK